MSQTRTVTLKSGRVCFTRNDTTKVIKSHTTGRSLTAADLASDILGAGLGAVLWWVFSRRGRFLSEISSCSDLLVGDPFGVAQAGSPTLDAPWFLSPGTHSA